MDENGKNDIEVTKLLEIFCSYKAWELDNDLFRDIHLFLQDLYKILSFSVYSFPKNIDSTDKTAFDLSRDVWNKNKNSFNKEIIKQLINDYKNIMIDEVKHLTQEKNNYYSFFIGENERQNFIGIFSAKRQIEVESSVFKYLMKFNQNAFKSIQKWKLVNQNSRLAHIDDVTGLYNQRKLQKDLDTQIEIYKKCGEGFAILFMDVDHFKEVNDGHGHLIGSRLLAKLAIILKQVLRESDLVYRYGGDEFVMIVPNANTEDGRVIGERLLTGIINSVFTIHEHKEFKISVSIGIASYPHDAKTRDDVLGIADQMMYYAKARGRGRVCYAGDLISDIVSKGSKNVDSSSK